MLSMGFPHIINFYNESVGEYRINSLGAIVAISKIPWFTFPDLPLSENFSTALANEQSLVILIVHFHSIWLIPIFFSHKNKSPQRLVCLGKIFLYSPKKFPDDIVMPTMPLHNLIN